MDTGADVWDDRDSLFGFVFSLSNF